ncbi:hypothetical protein Slin15195_G056430 [Septoria linicola]|uniref:Uncharacterized protein n=1 Tax=Septoria linicola TaxID=215465 RepID=A0A9Q9AN26_9PEZI|nr:hypothetical protein Slin14017_G072310 [Septoria linicola]USW52324.1 hypothetical protein Slin15195_G056430 [Septoria linicola]
MPLPLSRQTWWKGRVWSGSKDSWRRLHSDETEAEGVLFLRRAFRHHLCVSSKAHT